MLIQMRRLIMSHLIQIYAVCKFNYRYFHLWNVDGDADSVDPEPTDLCNLDLHVVWIYRKNSKYWDMYVWAYNLDSDQTALKEQSDQDLHCLPFFLHLLEALFHCKIKLF